MSIRLLKKTLFVVLALGSALGVFLFLPASFAAAQGGTPPSGDGVVPILYSDNPDCADLGLTFGFKIDGHPEGNGLNFTFIEGVQHGISTVHTGGAIDDTLNSITIDSDGYSFDWMATLGIDAIIVKGGADSNAYVYVPEDTADTNLISPLNASGSPAAISHIEICYDYELAASKTALTSYTRTYTWTIEKTVTPADHLGLAGDTFVSDYEVAVDQTVLDSDFAVSGVITVSNPTPYDVGFTASDLVGGSAATVNCLTTSLAPGASTTCSYSASLAAKVDGTNTATITSNSSPVGGTTASKDYAFGDPTTIVGEPAITVSDSVKGSLGAASGDKTFNYSLPYSCSTDQADYNASFNDKDTYPNTATITETGQSDDASVTVDCYVLRVKKFASTTLTRNWTWTIDKLADQSELLLSPGQLFTVNYGVTLAAAPTDSDWAVSGTIVITNLTPLNAEITSITDLISPDIAAQVTCPYTYPFDLPSGWTVNCSYSSDLPDGTVRTNTATASVQNYAYASDGTKVESGTTAMSGSTPVNFAGATVTAFDECVEVSDTNVGVLGTVCVDELPKTFTYSLDFGQHPDADIQLECGDNSHSNIASFVTDDTGTTGSDTWVVDANVACGTGCTLTQGYWKTHSTYGPAPYDDTWALIGEDTPFFSSGKTWYQVLWTPPSGGNAYYILAHQYIAARLNLLNGASTTTEVDEAMVWAEHFFQTNLPGTKLPKDLKAETLAYADLLDQFNNGDVGPGHCSETMPESSLALFRAGYWGNASSLFLPLIGQ